MTLACAFAAPAVAHEDGAAPDPVGVSCTIDRLRTPGPLVPEETPAPPEHGEPPADPAAPDPAPPVEPPAPLDEPVGVTIAPCVPSRGLAEPVTPPGDPAPPDVPVGPHSPPPAVPPPPSPPVPAEPAPAPDPATGPAPGLAAAPTLPRSPPAASPEPSVPAAPAELADSAAGAVPTRGERRGGSGAALRAAQSFTALFALAAAVAVFLIVQGRVDRREDKLRGAPLETDFMDFQ